MTKTKFCLLILMLSCFCSAYAQSHQITDPLFYEKNSPNMRLKGPVKSVQERYVSFRKGLNINEIGGYMAFNDVRYTSYREFAPDGLLTFANNKTPVADTIYHDYDHKSMDQYWHDPKELVRKRSLRVNLQYYPVLFGRNLMVIPDENIYSYSYGIKQLIQSSYDYKTDGKGRISEASEYFITHLNDNDTIVSEARAQETLSNRVVYYYNEKDQVIRQRVYAGAYPDELEIYFCKVTTFVCADTEYRYQYDDKGRITQALLYNCGKTACSENYIYNNDGDYIEKVACYVDPEVESGYATPHFTISYNANGDVLQKEFFPEKDAGIRRDMDTRYYTYEYDAHKNWIRCNLYLEGKKEGGPTVVMERKIDYYGEAGK